MIEVVHGDIEGSMPSTSGDHWLDTQNSAGPINITNWFNDPTGDEFVLSFDIGVHDFGDGPTQETAHDATFEVQIDGVAVRSFSWADFNNAPGDLTDPETMNHIEFIVDVDTGVDMGNGSVNHTISLVDTTVSQGNYTRRPSG